MACKSLMQHVERAGALGELIEFAGEPLAAVIAEGEVHRVKILDGLVARRIGAGHLELHGDRLVQELAQALIVRVFLRKLREALAGEPARYSDELMLLITRDEKILMTLGLLDLKSRHCSAACQPSISLGAMPLPVTSL